MSRSNVTYEMVKSTAESLQKQGERPTINRVKESLDGQGSNVLISQFLKQWRQESQPAKASESSAIEVQTLAPIGTKPVEQTQKPAQVHAEPKPATEPKPKSEDQPTQKKQVHKKPNDEAKPAEGADKERSQPSRSHQKDRNNNNNNNKRRKDRDRKPKSNGNYHSQQPQEPPQVTVHYLDYYTVEKIDNHTQEELITLVRRLEAMLVKEQSRREVADKLNEESKTYAEVIKEQVSKRINDLKQVNERLVEQLKQEYECLKASTAEDLSFYREQLAKANAKIISLQGDGQVDLINDHQESDA